MNTLRKIFASALVLGMMFSMFAGMKTVNAAASAGSLIKMNGLSTVYYLGSNMKRYVFPNEATFKSWYADFSNVQTISQSELESYPLGANVTMRPGTWLIKITTNPTVYAVEPGGKLRSIVSEANAISLWGANWASKVRDVADGFFTNYTITTSLTAGMYPAGSLVKMASSADVYYFDGTNYRKFASESAFTSNRFRFEFVQTAPNTMSFTPMGADITGVESGLTDTSSGAGGSITGSGLSVALSSSTPASTTYLRDVSGTHAQALASFTTLNFTASNDGDAVVNTVKVTRSGLSTDTDLQNVYLFDGNTQIADMTSFSNKVITFNNSAGLFTVTKGSTRAITVKADIATGTSNVSGIILGVNAASDVVASGATITGSFPMTGNSMAVNTVSDLGYSNISSFTTIPATLDPGLTNQELWRFNVQANDQDMAIEKIMLTAVGTISQTDLANFKLEVGGVQVGSTVASMNSAKELVFSFSTPWVITSGQTKTISLKGDVIGGTGRSFKFTIRKAADFMVKDNNYGVYVAPMVSSAAFTIVQPSSSTSINNGTMTVAVATDSPTGNVPAAGTNVPLARFTYKANGEDIKVSSVRVSVDTTSAIDVTDDLRNGKLYFNGSQVGSTDTKVDDVTTNVFTMTQVIAAGTTGIFEYRADLVDDTAGAALLSGDTVVVSLVAGTTDATGQSSLASIATASATARTLTVATGTLTVAKNLSLANYSASNPTGVAGATNAKVGSLVITAGAGEGVTVTQIVVGDEDVTAAVSDFGASFQNLTLKNSAGVALATTQGTLSSTQGADYTFTLSPAITVAAGAQYVVDIYADILTGTGGAGTYTVAEPGLEFVNLSATTLVTSVDAYPTATLADLQNVYIATGGALTITADSSTPIAAQVLMGEATATEFAKLEFAASSSEDVNVTRIEISDSSTDSENLNSISLWDGTTQVGATLAAFDASHNAAFNLATPWTITKGTSKILTVKAFVNAFPNATSAETIQLAIVHATDDVTAIGASSGAPIAETVTSATGTLQTVVKTKVTITKAGDSPSGASSGTLQQTVAKFNVTNSANVGNYPATLKTMTVNMSSTITLAAANVYYVSFYKDSVSGDAPNEGNSGVGTGNALASIGVLTVGGACTTAGNLTCVVANPVNTFTNSTIADARFADVSIAAGATKTIFVVADTQAAGTGKNFSAGIAANGVTWNDGVNDITTVNSLPISGSTLTY